MTHLPMEKRISPGPTAAERGHQRKSAGEERCRRRRLRASRVSGIPRRLSLSQGVRRNLTADVGVHGME